MQPRRRLPLLAGMTLSTVIITAPAAHADDFLRPRQDCSKTLVQTAEDKGVVGDVLRNLRIMETGPGDLRAFPFGDKEKNIRTIKMKEDAADITIDDSFNCSNTINRSFRHKFREHRRHGYGHNDWSDKR